MPEVSIPGFGAILAIDWGERRFGIAVSDPSQTISHPLTVLTRRTGRRFPMQQLRTILDERKPVAIVMGLPLGSDGHEGERCVSVRAIGDLISSKTDLPVDFVDERFSTARIHAVRRETGTTGQHGTIDDRAAAVILQQFLDSRR